MRSVRDVVQSLGNAGAVANARAAMLARRREDAMVRALARRVSAPPRRRPGAANGGRAA